MDNGKILFPVRYKYFVVRRAVAKTSCYQEQGIATAAQHLLAFTT
jgi:hypothetical protein